MIELADTSAWTASRRSEAIREDFADRLSRREIGTCEIVKLELLWSVRDPSALAEHRDQLEELRNVPIRDAVWRRAGDVMERMAARGPLHHRQVGIVDLVIAAAAEAAEIPVLHYDRDFELIAEVTGQPVRAIAPLGSLG